MILYSYFATIFLVILLFNFMLMMFSFLRVPMFITELLFKIELIVAFVIIIGVIYFKII